MCSECLTENTSKMAWFSVTGPSVWNSLPADIRHITDISKFKRHLKTHLFNLYFNT